jgi:hypothetical protein
MTTEPARREKRNRVEEGGASVGVSEAAAAGETNAPPAAANGSAAAAANAGAASNLIIQLVSETGEILGRFMICC